MLLYILLLVALVAQLFERLTCDWKVSGSNKGLEELCLTISIVSAPNADLSETFVNRLTMKAC